MPDESGIGGRAAMTAEPNRADAGNVAKRLFGRHLLHRDAAKLCEHALRRSVLAWIGVVLEDARRPQRSLLQIIGAPRRFELLTFAFGGQGSAGRASQAACLQ